MNFQDLTALVNALESTSAKNLKSGFRKCSILPADRREVLQRLPMYNIELVTEVNALVGETFIQNLNSKRQVITSTRT